MTGLKLLSAASIALLKSFGFGPDWIQDQNPHYAFRDEEPVLWVMRGQRLEGEDCAPWVDALARSHAVPVLAKLPTEADWSGGWKAWEPWSEDDLEAVTDCDSFPCAVKLDKQETLDLAQSKETARMGKFKKQVWSRAIAYGKNQERKGAEFPGKPVNSWSLLEKHGVFKLASVPQQLGFEMRKLDFAPGKIRAIRQVVDRRVKVDSSGREAMLWLKDVYTDHYFDSWGEWAQVSCSENPKTVFMVHALILEFDLLKKTDVFSRMMTGKMKKVIRENGERYLEDSFRNIKAVKGAGSKASDSDKAKVIPLRS